MIDYKNYKITKKNKNSILDWVVFTVITVLLWIAVIEILFG
jgi:hypothetical protein